MPDKRQIMTQMEEYGVKVNRQMKLNKAKMRMAYQMESANQQTFLEDYTRRNNLEHCPFFFQQDVLLQRYML